MPRGQSSKPGDERTSPNGYLYRKTEDRGWVTVHRLSVEEKIGRHLRDDEYVAFRDGNKSNIDIDNLEVRKRGVSSLKRRLASIEDRIREMQAEKDLLERRIEIRDSL